MTADQNWPMRPHEVGASARALRHRSGLRQSDVAARAGVSQSMVSRVERGAWDEIQWASITRVCEAAGLRVAVEGRWRGGEPARLLDQDHAALTAARPCRLSTMAPDPRRKSCLGVYWPKEALDVGDYRLHLHD